MCKAFACIVGRDGMVYWKAGLDSHDSIFSHFRLKDDTANKDLMVFARVEITPPRGYLYPTGKWIFQLDERVKPTWWQDIFERKARLALVEWKREVYAMVDYKQARKPVNPLMGIPKQPTTADIQALKVWASVGASVWASVGDSVWASVGASVGDSVWDSVGDSVRASVGDSVRASVGASVWASVRASVGASVGDSVIDSVWGYCGSLFTPPQWANGYPYQSIVDLWKRGFVPSYGSKVWRLHSGRKAEIVYTEGEKYDTDK